MSQLDSILTSNLRKEKLAEFKRVVENTKIDTRKDDEFLLRFLLARNFDVGAAFNKLKSYEEFRKKYSDSWLRVSFSDMKLLADSKMLDVFPQKDKQGRRICWLRAGLWDPNKVTADKALQIGGLIAETMLSDPANCTNGLVAIFDMHNFGLSQIKGVSPSFAKKMVNFMADCLPMKVHAVHVIREPAFFALAFAVFKKFLDDRMKERIFLHGQDISTLSKHLDSNVLPKDLGGNCEDFDTHRWLNVINSEPVYSSLQKSGYVLE